MSSAKSINLDKRSATRSDEHRFSSCSTSESMFARRHDKSERRDALVTVSEDDDDNNDIN